MSLCDVPDPLGPYDTTPSPEDCCPTTFLDPDGDPVPVSAANPLPVEATVDVGDITIGNVRIEGGVSGLEAEVDLPANLTSADLAVAVHDAATAGTATQAADLAVAGASVAVLAANALRKSAVVQNVGAANVRVAVGAAAAAATGLQLAPGQSLVLSQPYCPTAVINAIREGAVSSTVSVLEVT